jgi:hypothetical protein
VRAASRSAALRVTADCPGFVAFPWVAGEQAVAVRSPVWLDRAREGTAGRISVSASARVHVEIQLARRIMWEFRLKTCQAGPSGPKSSRLG